MKEWYLIDPQPTFNGGLEKEEFVNYVSDGFNEILTETHLGQDCFLCKGKYDGNKFEVEMPIKGIVQSETPDAETQAWKRQFLTYIGAIGNYKYVKYENDIYLIMTEPSNNQIYEKVILFLCNYIAKYQDKDGKIILKPFNVQNNSQYNSGESENKTLTIGYNQLLVYTSLDNETVWLSRNKRMFIDYRLDYPVPYKLTRHDTVSSSYGKNRVITLIFTEDQYNPKTDSIEEWLCDCMVPLSDSPAPSFEITHTGKAEIRTGGINKTFSVPEYDSAFTQNIVWSAELSDEQSGYVVLSPSGNQCKVKCLSNEKLVGTKFKLKCVRGNKSGEIEITVAGGV